MENAVRNAEHPRLTGDLPAIPEALFRSHCRHLRQARPSQPGVTPLSDSLDHRESARRTTDGTVSHAGDGELTLGSEFGWLQLSGDRARRSADGSGGA